MDSVASDLNDYDAIAEAVRIYVDAAKRGRGADMHDAFHQDATIFGYADGSMFAGPIRLLFELRRPGTACDRAAGAFCAN